MADKKELQRKAWQEEEERATARVKAAFDRWQAAWPKVLDAKGTDKITAAFAHAEAAEKEFEAAKVDCDRIRDEIRQGKRF